MKRIILLVLPIFLSAQNLMGQLTINNSYTPAYLVNNILLPTGSSTVTSNVQLIGVMNVSSRYQIGAFQTANSTLTQMGFGSGIIITSGNTTEIPLTPGVDPKSTQVSRNYTSCTTGEVRKGGTCPYILNDLTVLAGTYNYYNTAMLEFDFVAAGDAVSFRYIFGSEEYEDNSGLINYQCSDYNDRFAFLLSGPGISGGQGYTSDAKNIARTANGSIVAINSVNNGVVGSSGGAPSAAKCLAANPAWVNGSATAEYLGTIDGTNMNGNTRILTAFQSGLIPGQTYHIRLIIMDINDGAYDSVVYLESASFTTEATPLPVVLEDFSGKCTTGGVQLNWTTSNERNVQYYSLEKYNATKNDFEIIGHVNASGNSVSLLNYSYFDENPGLGNNIYRLLQTDINGTSSELRNIVVSNSCTDFQDITSYIDASNNLIITYSGEMDMNVDLLLYDLSGKLVFTMPAELNSGMNKYELNQSLTNGLYLLNFKNNTGEFKLKVAKSQ